MLAAAGLLDGRRATTHWLGARALAERYPAVEVDPDVLYVDGGRILTSAGAAAGLDLRLHMVRRDYGAAVAADAARAAVMPLESDGGQAQFITRPRPASAETLEPLLARPAENLHGRLSPTTRKKWSRKVAAVAKPVSVAIRSTDIDVRSSSA